MLLKLAWANVEVFFFFFSLRHLLCKMWSALFVLQALLTISTGEVTAEDGVIKCGLLLYQDMVRVLSVLPGQS